jgi:hypothetical protein
MVVAGGLYAQELSGLRLEAVQSNQDTIEVLEASYGKNRKKEHGGNATKFVKEACDKKRSCNFPVSTAASALGTQAPGETKDFEYFYLCGNRQKEGKIEAEANGKTATLTCEN